MTLRKENGGNIQHSAVLPLRPCHYIGKNPHLAAAIRNFLVGVPQAIKRNTSCAQLLRASLPSSCQSGATLPATFTTIRGAIYTPPRETVNGGN